MPTLRDFLTKARAEGIAEGTSQTPIVGPKGALPFRYLRRGTGPIAPLPDIADTDRLTPTQLSNLCRLLDIDPSEFGFTLGFLNDPLS